MALVLLLAAVIWGIGWAMGAPVRARLAMLGVLYAAVLGATLLLPEGSALRAAMGGSPLPWLVLGGAVTAVAGYRALLSRLRARARAPAAPGGEAPEAGAASPAAGGAGAAEGPFRPAELERYARHIMLRELGGPGQRRLRAARVLVVGAGGLGSPALLYLAAAGVGTLGVIDDDAVENANLQRQIIHTDARIGMPKVFSAEQAIRALNPFVTVRPYHRRLTEEIADALLSDYDLVLDGSDNFATRYLVNRSAVRTGRPLIAAAMTQWEGQISLYHPAAGGPCYQCVFPEPPAPGLVPSCAEAGIVAPLPGVIGSLMALEAVKTITGAGQGLMGRLLIYDALHAESRTILLRPRADCPVCGAGAGQPAARAATDAHSLS